MFVHLFSGIFLPLPCIGAIPGSVKRRVVRLHGHQQVWTHFLFTQYSCFLVTLASSQGVSRKVLSSHPIPTPNINKILEMFIFVQQCFISYFFFGKQECSLQLWAVACLAFPSPAGKLSVLWSDILTSSNGRKMHLSNLLLPHPNFHCFCLTVKAFSPKLFVSD